jgi:hypothetical protein
LQGLYVLGVVTAVVAAGYSAFMVGLERQRQELRSIRRGQGKPEILFFRSPGEKTGSTALERALARELRQWGRGDVPRHLN